MNISQFTVSPNVAILGETVKVRFDIELEPGERVRGPLQIGCGLLGVYTFVYDDRWSSDVSVSVTTFITIDPIKQDLKNQLASSRAVPDPEWTLGLDVNGELKIFSFPYPLVYLNARYAPSIGAFSVERGENGLPEDTGEKLLFTAKLSMTDVAAPSDLRVRLHYAQESGVTKDSPYIDLTDSLDQLLTGVTDDDSIVSQTFANSADWNFLLIFGDDYEQAQAGASVSEAFANLHLSGASTGGVCVGGFSSAKEGEPKFECHYPAYFYGGIALGGMQNITTEETDTGMKWLDGKTIYAKTLVHTGAAGNTAYELKMPAGVETVWLDTANSFHLNANGTSYPPYAVINNVIYFICLLSTSGAVYKTNAVTGGNFYIRVFYTKQ